ncbi:MAG: hypothetical protein J5497_01270, partial [Selenomonadaceae bacterium]|nr:hypothetical protein [Selenomonadaceae bacterium]
ITNNGGYYVGYDYYYDEAGRYRSGEKYSVGGSQVSINGGDGNDSIQNVLVRNYDTSIFSPDNSTLEGGAGNDTIENDGSNVTIDGGLGDDHIVNKRYSESGEEVYYYGGMNVLFKYTEGDGNDRIEGFRADSTLQIGGGTGTCSVISDGWNVIVQVGDGRITLAGATEIRNLNIEAVHSDFIYGTEFADNITNVFDNVTVEARGGNDTIQNWKRNVKIDGGAGNDSISNSGSNVSINAGDGEDTITNNGCAVTIDGGKGNDSIINEVYDYYNDIVDYVSINGGDGNDTITNNGCAVTITGGRGDDSIVNKRYYDYGAREYYGGESVLFKYSVGDGNDVIQGFRADSTLQIGDGTDTYLGVKSGNDIILTVGEGKITLSGAASLKSVNIEGTEVSTPVWNLNDTTATYGTWKNILITLTGVKSLNGISLKDNVVTVSNAALNQGTVTISNGYTLALGDDVTKSATITAGWNLSGSSATYNNTKTIAGYSLANNQISYVNSSGGDTLVTVSGVKSLSGISLK